MLARNPIPLAEECHSHEIRKHLAHARQDGQRAEPVTSPEVCPVPPEVGIVAAEQAASWPERGEAEGQQAAMSAIARPAAASGLRMGVTPKVGKAMKAGKSSGAGAGRDQVKAGPAGAGRDRVKPKGSK